MRGRARRRDNEPVHTDETRVSPGWRQQLRDVLRPEPKGAPPSRMAIIADVVLALVLTVLALVAAAGLTADDRVIRVDPYVRQDPGTLPVPPVAPDPPLPLYYEVHHTPWFLTVLTVLPLAGLKV